MWQLFGFRLAAKPPPLPVTAEWRWVIRPRRAADDGAISVRMVCPVGSVNDKRPAGMVASGLGVV